MLFRHKKPVLPDNKPKIPVGVRITGGLVFMTGLVLGKMLEVRYGLLITLIVSMFVSISLLIACKLGKESEKPYSMFIMFRNVSFAITAIYLAPLVYLLIKSLILAITQ